MDIIAPGKNCHRLEKFGRAAFLIDGKDYFKAFRSAVLAAEKQVLIAGWDLDSRVELVRGPESDPKYPKLSGLLDGIVEERPDLHIYVLIWDFAMLYALEREALPVFKLGWKTHKRVHFHMDDEHPLGASHHQKVVVVDDKVAFSGGLDLTKHRWDTRDHKPKNPLRKDPNGKSYRPFHDVQMMVDGDAARALGDLVRERWLRAMGETLDPPGESGEDPWPEWVEPDLTDARLAIALTDPAFKGRPEVRQVEDLYVDSIMGAKESIYIENQYFTSHKIAAALGARLREKDGPEIVMVLPKHASGWLEEGTMGVIRAKLVNRLKEEDRENRLRVFHPVNNNTEIMMHAKVMVVDDVLLRIGSANLSNRSMGLDTECDLVIEAENGVQKDAVIRFRNDLLGEHLGVYRENVQKTIEAKGSLAVGVESMRRGRRTLAALEPGEPKWVENIEVDMVDPEQPVKLDRMIDKLVDDQEAGGARRWFKYAAIVLTLAGLAVLWRFTDMGKSIDVGMVKGWAESIRHSALAPLYVVLGFLVASLIVFPVTILVIVTAAVFPPFQALGYMLGGVLVSSLVNYLIGRSLGRDLIRRVPGGKLNRLSKRLAERGIWAIIAVRNLPVAPYTVVNAVAGASHIRMRDFIIGTLAGMLPGLVAVTFFTDQLAEAILNPDPGNVVLAIVLGAVLFAGLYYLRRRLKRREAKSAQEQAP
jgi:phosphatidylserine/phosphatidylglycerophosphate/cardiolipin synthase-like enzyme/uncharacterized membrane protein YdjX (TVP38/TMEM64 family)